MSKLWPSRRQWQNWTLPSRHASIGLLVAVVAVLVTVLAWRWPRQQAMEPLTALGDNIGDRVAARLSDNNAPLEQLDEIRSELGRAGADSPPTVIDLEEPGAPGLEDQLRRALQSIPAERRAEQERQVDALTAESRAQQFARDIDREFRPKVIDVLELLDRVISEAAAAGLVTLEGKSEPMALPTQLAYTTFTMSENGIPTQEPERRMVFRFTNGAVWTIYWQNGMVRSPPEFNDSLRWDAPTDKYYPMLLLQHSRGTTDLLLGTVWFHQDSKELGFNLNARNQLPAQARVALEKIEQERVGTDQLSGMLVELLKGLRL